MFKYPSVFILVMAFATIISAQREANIWYFGHNAGLDFNECPPVPLLDGALDTDEGCASISDSFGNLLFYTDGTFVWNRNHQLMPNGSGLLGNKSSTQSGVIIPKPDAENIYYVFTVDFTAGPGGISFSEVDMTLDSGLGDIVPASKNTTLLTPACEKITAVAHANGTDVWVVGHAWNSSNFMAWLITPTGVNINPVVTTIGTFINTSSNFNSIGYMKASPSGKKIAAAHWYDINVVEVFDFDNATGVLSNAIQLTGYTGSGCYGVEFAPLESILYVSERAYGGFLYQYDLSSNNETLINDSRIALASYFGRWGAIQMGPDGNMYVSKRDSEYLGVINNPNIIGTGCNYVDEGVYLGGQVSWIGLPSFNQSFFESVDFSFDGICPNQPTNFTLITDEVTFDSLEWNFDDPNSGSNNVSYEFNPTHSFSTDGVFEVDLIIYTQCNADTISHEIEIIAPPLDLGDDLEVCSNTVTTLNATVPSATYLWSDGSQNPTLQVNNEGMYWVEVNVNGCVNQDSITITHVDPIVDLGNDLSFCEDEPNISIDGTTTNADSYLWNNNSTDSILQVNQSGNYTLTVTASAGCTATDQIFVDIIPLPVFQLGVDTLVCEGDTYVLDMTAGNNSTYTWQDGSTDPVYNITNAGTYQLQITTDGCSSQDEINIEMTNLPTVDLGSDTFICVGTELTLNAYYDEYTSYTWQNNSDLAEQIITEAGIYSVALENKCGVVTDEIIIEEMAPPTPIFIGNDTTICMDESLIIDATNSNTDNYLWQDGSTETNFEISEAGFYGITWSNQCGFVTESIEVETRVCECPVILPNAFSPDENGWNDKFNTVSPCDFYDFNLKIFNRWGALVFETNDPSMSQGWDGRMNGKDVQEGVYIYVVEFTHEFDSGQVSGDVTVVR